MAEIRRKLTETQFRLLVSAQIKYDRAVAESVIAVNELNTVRALVLDAHELDGEVDSWMDAKSQELVIQKEEEDEKD